LICSDHVFNHLLRMLNGLGAMPESLSGSYYRLLDNGVPHQMFSELTAMPGLVEGVLGLDLDVPGRILRLAPHLPPAWPDVAVSQFPNGNGRLNIQLHQEPGRLSAMVGSAGAEDTELMFSPALPAGRDGSFGQGGWDVSPIQGGGQRQ